MYAHVHVCVRVRIAKSGRIVQALNAKQVLLVCAAAHAYVCMYTCIRLSSLYIYTSKRTPTPHCASGVCRVLAFGIKCRSTDQPMWKPTYCVNWGARH